MSTLVQPKSFSFGPLNLSILTTTLDNPPQFLGKGMISVQVSLRLYTDLEVNMKIL